MCRSRDLAWSLRFERGLRLFDRRVDIGFGHLERFRESDHRVLFDVAHTARDVADERRHPEDLTPMLGLRDRAGNGLDALLHAVVGELLREIREEGSELSRVDLLLRCSEYHRFERA